MISLYRLDQIQGIEGKADLGPLPATSVWLLVCIAAAWVIMGIYVTLEGLKTRKNRKNQG